MRFGARQTVHSGRGRAMVATGVAIAIGAVAAVVVAARPPGEEGGASAAVPPMPLTSEPAIVTVTPPAHAADISVVDSVQVDVQAGTLTGVTLVDDSNQIANGRLDDNGHSWRPSEPSALWTHVHLDRLVRWILGNPGDTDIVVSNCCP